MRMGLVGASTPTGRRVAADLAEHPDVSAVVVADRDPGAARRVAEQLGGKAQAADLEELVRSVDAVVSCTGRDTDLEHEAALAAIDGRVPFVSGSEDLDAVEGLLALDERAGGAETLLLVGLSWSPGITNLMAVAAAAGMDEVRQVRVAWIASAGGGDGEAAVQRAVRALSGFAVTFEDGGWRREPAGGAAEEVFFPEPVGWQRVHLAAGPEALTLPSHLEGPERVVVKGGVSPRALDRAARAIGRALPHASPARAARVASAIRPLLPWAGRVAGVRDQWSAARVDVVGVLEGGVEQRTYGVLDQAANLASAPLVVGAVMLAGGAVKGVGALPPEAVLEPAAFFWLLAARGVRVARLER